MEEEEKKININTIEKEDEKDMSIEIDNLNINQEVDIKENPKKHIVNAKKKQILINSIEEDNISENLNSKKQKEISISYDDIYLGNEMFFSAPRSYPGDYDKKNKFLTDFSQMYNKKNSNRHNSIYSYISNSGSNRDSSNRDSNNLDINTNSSNHNSSSTNNISNMLLAEEEELDDDDYAEFHNNSFDNLDMKKESSHLKDFISSINHYRISTNIFSDEKNTYTDEDELKNQNIFFIENETELNDLNYYSRKNKCNISYISLNLFIKEICTGDLKNKFPILYKSFINQYQEFLTIPSLIEKIIDAMNFYIKKMGIEIPDLISLLNKIISTQFKRIENDDDLIEKIKNVYKDIKQLKWIGDSLGKEIDNVNFVLSENTSDEFDVEFTKYLISDRRKSKAISIRSSNKGKNLNIKNKLKNKNTYFYIFDFSDEEIARNLTLISYKLLSCIDINELWTCKFTKDDKYIKAPNVMKVIDRFDKLMLFIIEDICSYETNKARAKLITKWANIAKRCRDLHNYNDLLIINQCFNHNLLKKMVSTWKKIPKSTLELISDLNKFCTNQQCYINIRREIVGCKHIAYIPYLGILLKELVDIENKYKYAEKFGEYNCINCVKLQKMYYIVNKFFEFKNYTFTFTQINELNILSQINPKNSDEIDEMITDIEKNKFNIKQLLQSSNKKKQTKTDQLFYC
jgi:hypothetical protein